MWVSPHGHFLFKGKEKIPNPTEGSPYIILKRTQLHVYSIGTAAYYLQENILSSEDENVDLHMYYVLNMTAVNYFWHTNTREEEIDGQMKVELGSESADLHEKIWMNQKTNLE